MILYNYGLKKDLGPTVWTIPKLKSKVKTPSKHKTLLADVRSNLLFSSIVVLDFNQVIVDGINQIKSNVF